MHLTEIQIENFKSFGRKVRIPFLPGFTSVTGPNGSGKSNIGDAILFVLGPKSSKVLRAGKLTDLIFNGGKSGKPADSCKVTLVFDNSDRVIPVDEDEVRLTRLVRRAPGEEDKPYSYYYMNERRCDLQDVDRILAHARISAEGYNLVQQGDVTRLVQMSPMDRRRVLESIAGITQYDEDIARAGDQRKSVEENLAQVGVRMEEIQNQLKLLERERNDALKYRGSKERLDLAKAQLAHRRKADLEDEIGRAKEQMQQFEEQKKENLDKVEQGARQLQKMRLELDEIEKKVAELGGEEGKAVQAKIDEAKMAGWRAREAADKAKERQKAIKEERAALQASLRTVEKEADSLRRRREEVAAALSEAEAGKAEKERELRQLQDSVARSDVRALALQREIALKKKAVEEKEREAARLSIEVERLADRLKRNEEERTVVEERLKKQEFALKELDFQAKDISKSGKASEGELKALQERFYRCRNEEKRLAARAAELENSVKNLKRTYEMMRIEAESAANVQKGYTAAVNAVLSARDRGELRGIHGTVAELGDVKGEHTLALGMAAGARMQSVIVDNDEAAARAMEYLKKRRIGRATFLPMNKLLGGRPGGKALMAAKDPGAVGFAIDLVKFRADYRNAFWYVFGDTVVVRDMATLRKLMGGVRLVTLDGDIAESSGAMIGGFADKSMVKFGVPSATELDRVAKELREAIVEQESVAVELQKVRGELAEAERLLREAGAKDADAGTKLKSLEVGRSDITIQLDALKKERERVAREADESKQALDRASADRTRAEEEVAGLRQMLDEKARLLTKATPQELAAKQRALGDEILALSSRAAELKAQGEAVEAKIVVQDEKRKEGAARLDALNAESKELESSASTNLSEAERWGAELEALQEMSAKLSLQSGEMNKKRDALYKSATVLENELNNLRGRVDTAGEMIVSLQAKSRSMEERLGEVALEIQSVSAIEVKGRLPPADELNATVRECEAALQSLGQVNMLALEQYDTQMKRREEVESELGGLKEQREHLIKLVEELNTKKKEGLAKVLTAVNANYKRIYGELSDGGAGELLLEKPESPFEGGLIIRAQPPDKKVRRIDALSGGEKSLAAVALIFSIQQYQPSPFYLLDEVDQNLDVLNAEIVAKMVKRNTAVSQFIVITLRKVTLKEADHIYGVTTMGTGVSVLVGRVNLANITEEGEIVGVSPEKAKEEEDDGKGDKK